MSFIKVDVFLKKFERYLRTGHGLDLITEDISDYVLDSLDDYAYRWFDMLRKPYPYVFAQFNRDLRGRYVPIDYKEQLSTEYHSVKQGDDRLFGDYWTELKDYESMLGDVSEREKYTTMRDGLNEDLRRQMLVFTGVPMEEFAAHASRIDPQLLKARKDRKAKDSKKSAATDSASTSASTVSKSGRSNTSQSSGARYRPTSGDRRSAPARKPAVKELKPEISRQEADRLGLCRHCKEPGHVRRNCPKLAKGSGTSTSSAYPASNAITLVPRNVMKDAFYQLRLPTVNKVRQGYAVKDARTYKEAAMGKSPSPALEAPSWSIEKKVLPISTGDHRDHQTLATSLPRLEEPFIARISINNVPARCLIDTGASGDFVSTHFTFVNRLKHRKLDAAIPIQQAVKGSKPKCNAVASTTIQFGDWSKKTSMYVIHLANYDAIIGLPTLLDAGAKFDLASKTLRLHEYGVSLPLERFQPPVRPPQKFPAKGVEMSPSDTARPPTLLLWFRLRVWLSILLDDIQISADPPVFSVYPRVDKNGSPEYYRDLILDLYADVFVDKLPAMLPPLRAINHRIPVKIEKPWMAPLYRLPEHHKRALEADIELKLRAGIIVPTTELPLATSHMVPKKDPGEFRHVQDLRRRNKDTETLVWPLPPTDDIVDKVARSPERSKIDLVQSFDQIRVEPTDVPKTAFRTHRGNYLHLTMQMGDRNATSTEQQLLDTVFDPIRDYVVNYLDDIMPVNTMTPYEHFIALCKIFDILRKQRLFVNRKKTKLYIPYDEPLSILGVDIQNGQITPEITKVEAFNALPSPQSFQELGKALGSFTWLSAHIPASQELAAPLHQLLHGERWFWTPTSRQRLPGNEEAGHESQGQTPDAPDLLPRQSLCLR